MSSFSSLPAPTSFTKQANIDWRIDDHPLPYLPTLAAMTERAEQIYHGEAAEMIWLLQHPPLFTAGTSANEKDLFNPHDYPVYQAGRGGQYTYHGPGQRIVYVMLDLRKRGRDVRQFVSRLEQWMIDTLADFNVTGERRPGRVGIWVPREPGLLKMPREDKIGAIGIRLRRWISFHGMALNVEPNLKDFDGIVPCGIGPQMINEDGQQIQTGVTSLVDLGYPVTLTDVDNALINRFETIFQADQGDTDPD